MKRLVIAIDCDEVLVPGAAVVVKVYNSRYGTSVKFEEAYEPNNPDWRADREEVLRRFADIQLASECAETPPFDDAVEACRRLAESHELHLVTARETTAMPATMAMIHQYFPDVFTEIEHVGDGGNKGDICRRLYADVLIDDSLKHLESARACGVANLLWFGDYPWNKSDTIPEGVLRCVNWSAVEKEIDRIARLQLEG